MAAGTPLSAKNANIRLGATVYYGEKWDVKPETTLQEANSFEGGGYENDVACLIKCEYDVTAWFDRGQNPFDLGLQAGSQLTTTKLYLSGVTSPFWLFPTSNLRSTPHTADVRDIHRTTWTAKAAGSFTYPTGNF